MTRALPLLLICTLSAVSWAAAPDSTPAKPAAKASAASPNVPQTEEDKTAYAIGELVSGNLKSFSFNKREIQMVQVGLGDGLKGAKSAVNVDEYRAKAQALQTARMAVVASKEKDVGKAYRDEAAKAKGATTTSTGIVITTLTEGTGAAPAAEDQVKVNYEGKLIDGTVFDSSIQRGQPATFKLSQVVPCWGEALQHMKVGGKSQIVCPSDTAYGDRGSPPKIAGGATLVFNVELLDIVK